MMPFAAMRMRKAAGGAGDPDYASVKLLLDLDGTNGQTTFTDFSASPASVSNAGTGAAISTAQSKFGGASLLLNGSSQGLNTTRQMAVGAGQFTIEAHVRPNAAQAGRVISCQQSISTNALLMFRTNADGSLTFFIRNSAGAGAIHVLSAAGLVAMNNTVWYHIAATRDAANRIDIWLDGTSVANGTSATNPDFAGNNYDIGSQYFQAEWFSGYIDNVRITEGVCRYTTTFTPPTAAYPHST